MAEELTVVKSWPAVDIETPPAPSPVRSTLDLISQYESGNRNVPNYRFDPAHTAQGYYQITNTNWNQVAPKVGIDTSDYPNAMSAPRDVQAKVATYLLTQTPAGIRNWTDYNPRLRAALGTQGTAARSEAAPDAGPSPVQPTAAQAASGIDDILARMQRGENVEVTPEDILRVAFGPTGVTAPAAQAPAPEAPEAPLTVVKSWPAPPAAPTPPPQAPFWQRALNAFTQSTGLKLLEGLTSSPAAAVGRVLGSPDYAAEQSFKNAIGGLYGGIVGEPKRIYDELQKSGEAFAKVANGDIGALNDAADHLWFTVPFLGAAGAKMKEYLDKGDIAGALGHATGVLGAAIAGSPESRAALGEAATEAPGAVAEAARTGATFAGGALPAAAKAAAKRPPYYSTLAGGLIGGPKGAAIAATLVKAPSVIRAGLAGGREALAERAAAAETAAGEAAPVATAAESMTPGQAYAASQGVDWSTLRPSDQQMMEDIARARANVATQAPPQAAAPAPQAAPPIMNQAERRATAMPPETGVPEAVERAQLEREAIIGKPRDQWTNSEVIAADELRREGYTGAQPPAPTVPAAQPAPVPPAGGLTIDDYAASISKSPSKLTDADRARFQTIRNMTAPAPAATSPRVMTPAEAAQTFPDVYPQPAPAAPTMPAAAPQVPQVAPEPTAAAPQSPAPLAGGLPKIGDTIEVQPPSLNEMYGRQSPWYKGVVKELRRDPVTGDTVPIITGPGGREMAGPPGYWRPAPTIPAAAPEVPQVAPEAPAAAPAAVAPESPLGGKAAALDAATKLEDISRVDRVTDFLRANYAELTPEDLDKFDPHDWELIGQGAGGRAPTAEQIAEIRGNVAKSAASVPAEVAKMPPAQAEGAVAKVLKKPAAPAAEPAAPTAAQARIEKLAQHFAKDTDLSPEAVASIADNPQAGLLLEKLSASLGIKGRPARGEIAKIAQRVRELRAQRR